MKKLKIFAAFTTPGVQDLLREVLTEHSLIFVDNLNKADIALSLECDFDLILCGLHFDNGKMYDLLKSVKQDTRTTAIPFVCLQVLGSILPYGTFKSMIDAFYLIGGNQFLQVAKWRIELGDEEAFRKLRDVVHSMAIHAG